MDADDIEYLEIIGDIHERTDGTNERVRVLCQLAESIDMDELRSLKSDASDAYAYPSLAKMDRATAQVVLDRLEAVEDFREELDGISESRR